MHGHGLDVDHRQGRQQLLETRVHQETGGRRAGDHFLLTRLVARRPPRALDVQTVDERPVRGVVVDEVRAHERRHVGLRRHLVQRHARATGSHLHHRRHEFRRPRDELRDAGKHVVELRQQVLLRRPRLLLPLALRERVASRPLVDADGLDEVLHGLRHVELPLHALVQLHQRAADLRQQRVHALAFLQRHDHEGAGLLRQQRLRQVHDGDHGEVLRQGLGQEFHAFLLRAAAAAPAAAAAVAAAERLDHLEDARRPVGQVTDLRVGVQAEHRRRVRRQLLVHIRQVPLVVQRGRVRRAEARAQFQVVEELVVDQHREVTVARAAVPSVGDVAAVHDLAENVPDVVPRHDGVGLDVRLQHVGADGQVARVEGVLARPPLLAEPPPPQHDGVEPAQREERRLEFRLLRARFDALVGEVGPATGDVRLDVRRRLVRDLLR